MSLISSDITQAYVPLFSLSPKQFSTSMSTMFSFPKRSSSISTQLILHFWFPIFRFFHSSQQELHAFSMTSNKGQSLVWMRRVLRDWDTFTVTKHKIGSKVAKQEKARPQTVKTDPLISYFCRHLKIEQRNIRLVCMVKLFGQTHWQTERDWEAEIAREGGEVQSGGFAYYIRASVKVCLEALALVAEQHSWGCVREEVSLRHVKRLQPDTGKHCKCKLPLKSSIQHVTITYYHLLQYNGQNNVLKFFTKHSVN